MDVVHLSKEYLGDITKHLCYDAVEGTVYEVHLGINNIALVFKIVSVEGLAKVVDVELDNNQLHKLIELCVGIPVKEEIVKEVSVFYKYTLMSSPLEVTPSKLHEFPTHLNKAVEFKPNPKAAPNIFDSTPNRTNIPPQQIKDLDFKALAKKQNTPTPKPEGDLIVITKEIIQTFIEVFNLEIKKEDIAINVNLSNELFFRISNIVEVLEVRNAGTASVDIYLLHTLDKNLLRVHLNPSGLKVFGKRYPDFDYPTTEMYLSKKALKTLKGILIGYFKRSIM